MTHISTKPMSMCTAVCILDVPYPPHWITENIFELLVFFIFIIDICYTFQLKKCISVDNYLVIINTLGYITKKKN